MTRRKKNIASATVAALSDAELINAVSEIVAEGQPVVETIAEDAMEIIAPESADTAAPQDEPATIELSAEEVAEATLETEAQPEAAPESDEPVSEKDLEAAVLHLEAIEVQEPEAIHEVQEEQAEGNNEPETFDAMLDAVDEEEVDTMLHAIGKEIDERADFEKWKNEDNANIQRTLKSARQKMVRPGVARVLLAANIDPAFMNGSRHDGSRYNVYAIGKFADIASMLGGGALTNAINIACMKSLFRFRAAGLDFTGELAKAAASDKVRVEAALRKHLVSHTVSASTAPTQASSTMQALQTIGAVSVQGSTRNPVYRVTDTPVARKIEELLAA
ncbi:hypothetical protein SAMN05216548_11438 [Faunimonas pinastri]|uniref:Uncharacterized protein n=1 Tax=Faunimonas pinastri TaxID=1855383 RepID=A0A1H9MT24_9HYPH|nr:hypothetical protein [Faunimonas pinastri]SER26866.1 hypothetical protein SAMN05216548_11438 [Faunimonas pinastri]